MIFRLTTEIQLLSFSYCLRSHCTSTVPYGKIILSCFSTDICQREVGWVDGGISIVHEKKEANISVIISQSYISPFDTHFRGLSCELYWCVTNCRRLYIQTTLVHHFAMKLILFFSTDLILNRLLTFGSNLHKSREPL